MKANNKTIIYDDTCPMCSWYTGAFVKTGLLQPDGRKAFSQADAALLGAIDLQRSKNEIPLLDTATGQVYYGIDAMLEVLGQKQPWIKKVGNIAPIKWFLYRLYRLVTYNRRVIVAPRTNSAAFDCAPDFNVRYRTYFMLFCLLLNTWLLFPLYQLFDNNTLTNFSMQEWLLRYAVLIAVNTLPTLVLPRKTNMEYLGQLTMLVTLFFLLCIPLLLINKAGLHTGLVGKTVYLCALGGLVGREYIRRMQYAHIWQHHPEVVALNIISMTAFFITLIA